MKKTPWFQQRVKPVRAGVYERETWSDGRQAFARWDGKKWMLSRQRAEEAAIETTHSPIQLMDDRFNDCRWRGLKEPK